MGLLTQHDLERQVSDLREEVRRLVGKTPEEEAREAAEVEASRDARDARRLEKLATDDFTGVGVVIKQQRERERAWLSAYGVPLDSADAELQATILALFDEDTQRLFTPLIIAMGGQQPSDDAWHIQVHKAWPHIAQPARESLARIAAEYAYRRAAALRSRMSH